MQTKPNETTEYSKLDITDKDKQKQRQCEIRRLIAVQTPTSHMHTNASSPKASLICFGWVSDAIFSPFTSMHRII